MPVEQQGEIPLVTTVRGTVLLKVADAGAFSKRKPSQTKKKKTAAAAQRAESTEELPNRKRKRPRTDDGDGQPSQPRVVSGEQDQQRRPQAGPSRSSQVETSRETVNQRGPRRDFSPPPEESHLAPRLDRAPWRPADGLLRLAGGSRSRDAESPHRSRPPYPPRSRDLQSPNPPRSLFADRGRDRDWGERWPTPSLAPFPSGYDSYGTGPPAYGGPHGYDYRYAGPREDPYNPWHRPRGEYDRYGRYEGYDSRPYPHDSRGGGRHEASRVDDYHNIRDSYDYARDSRRENLRVHEDDTDRDGPPLHKKQKTTALPSRAERDRLTSFVAQEMQKDDAAGAAGSSNSRPTPMLMELRPKTAEHIPPPPSVAGHFMFRLVRGNWASPHMEGIPVDRPDDQRTDIDRGTQTWFNRMWVYMAEGTMEPTADYKSSYDLWVAELNKTASETGGTS